MKLSFSREFRGPGPVLHLLPNNVQVQSQPKSTPVFSNDGSLGDLPDEVVLRVFFTGGSGPSQYRPPGGSRSLGPPLSVLQGRHKLLSVFLRLQWDSVSEERERGSMNREGLVGSDVIGKDFYFLSRRKW